MLPQLGVFAAKLITAYASSYFYTTIITVNLVIIRTLIEDAILTNKNVCWESPNGTNHSLPFDGVPFIMNGEKIYWCHQGKDKHKADKAANRSKSDSSQV